jgi:hypothetical protein
MKKLLIPLLLFPVAAHAQFKSGNDLLVDLNSNKSIDVTHAMGYVQGVVDAYHNIVICPPSGANGVTAGQVTDMVKNYLNNVPAERHFSASSIIAKSLGQVWPCAKGPAERRS